MKERDRWAGGPFSAFCILHSAFTLPTVDTDLANIVEKLINSYQTGGGTNNIDGSNLPSKRALATICEDLLQLLFPGFHDAEPIHSQHLRRVTQHRVFSVSERLTEEICKSLRLGEPACPQERAQEIVWQFLSTLPVVRELLRTDVEAAFQGDPAAGGTSEIILAYPYLEAIAIQRCAHMLYCHEVPLIPRMMTEWAHSRTGIDIHPGAHIHSHFFIDHGTGVVIGETSVIGQHVKMYQGVSLIARSLAGGRALKGKKRHPTVEDHVTIYAGSTIMGGDTVIGAGSTIGANVFLTHSVPPRSLVLAEGKDLRILDKDKRGDEALDWVI
jgi:serine O-acetyltransferase